jgi:hypothetical protein
VGRRARLQEFLGKRYPDSKKLRAFVDDTFGLDAVNSIGWEEGVNDETSDLITWLRAHERTGELWPALRAAFPKLEAEIAVHEAAWKPNAITRALPGVLRRSVPLQIGLGAAIAAGITITVILLWPEPPPPKPSSSTVIILDRVAREVIGKKEVKPSDFVLVVDGQRFPIPWRGLSFGEGPALPAELEARYRGEGIVDLLPKEEVFELPAGVSFDVEYVLAAKKCQPHLVVDGVHKLWLVKHKECTQPL